MSTEKGKSCNVSDINTVNRIVTERMVKGECLGFCEKVILVQL